MKIMKKKSGDSFLSAKMEKLKMPKQEYDHKNRAPLPPRPKRK